VVLLHGSASSSQAWRSLAGRLAARYTVDAPDLLGYGRAADWPGSPSFTFEQEALPLVQRIRRRGHPVHLVAHSYGAAVALQIAIGHGEWVRSLAIFEPAAFHLLRGGDRQDQLGYDEICTVAAGVARSVESGDREPGAAGFVDYWGGPGAWMRLAAPARDGLIRILPKVAMEFQAALHHPATAADLRRLRMPKLLLRGEASPLSARRVAARIAGAWGAADVEVIGGAGHMGPFTHPEAFGSRIEAHLEACSGRPR
jgi:pimeloyl-ACP methyl ester carboxylesterase